ncbi:hypothetical protein CVT24_006016 [Panaeolus cyanescens]|uniref:Uncharacterized protein n=1 Tax=Panaeolus cyanescens TaxID=181874 RepID=A0A409YE09_9AGAR|nr:hypothetical protein CVT24_006016 [Panaeolus cyanescens]
MTNVATRLKTIEPLVIIDGSSSSIRYEGEWLQMPPTSVMVNAAIFSEPPFSNVLRQAPPNKVVSLSHTFVASWIQLQATIFDPHNKSNWKATCTVDGQEVEMDGYTRGAYRNLYPFCEGRDLSTSSPHVFNFTIEVFDDQTGIWFDRLVTSPGPLGNLGYPLNQIPLTDPWVSYQGTWEDSLLGHFTNRTGSKAIINFNEIEAGVQTQKGKLLFRTPDREHGLHSAEVTYDVAGRALWLDYLVVENPGVDVSLVLVSVPDPRFAKVTTATLIGICVGVGAGVILVVAVVLFIFYRRRQQSKMLKKSQSPNPFPITPSESPSISSLTKGSPTVASPMRDSDSVTPIGPAMANSKGTPVSELPYPRQSLHLRTIHYPEETPPPYQQAGPSTREETQ